jgi:hypothetical protein
MHHIDSQRSEISPRHCAIAFCPESGNFARMRRYLFRSTGRVSAGLLAAALLFIGGTPRVLAEPGDIIPALHPSSSMVKTELTEVIEAQLAAFRSGDYPKAYAFAAAEIKEMFALNDFEEMVKTGYPVIAHAKKAVYGLALDGGDEAVITVRVQNANGESAAYQYHLKKQNGHWKIGGVTAVENEGLVV